jgi:hypothetical protein
MIWEGEVYIFSKKVNGIILKTKIWAEDNIKNKP